MEGKAGVFLVDHHRILVDGITMIINSTDDLFVCGSANCYTSALNSLNNASPDLMVIGLDLQDKSGLSLIESMLDNNRDCPLLILSMHREEFFAPRAIACGARGFISKTESSTVFIKAIRTILQGNIYISSDLATKLLENNLSSKPAGSKKPTKKSKGIFALSPRELIVFEMLGHGKSTKEIASDLFISVKTVETHRQRIRKKLNIDSSLKLTVYAANWITHKNI